jgi:phosphoribosylamine--glycine ligase
MNVLSLIPGKEANDVADFLEICEAIIQGNLNRLKVQWKPLATVCKYAVPEGYPDKPIKGIPIDTGDVNQAYASIYYASVEEEQGQLLLAGSRAVAVLAMHSDVAEAEKLAEAEIQKIHGPVFHRSDIGTEALIRQKTQMMRAIRSGLVD